MSVSHAGVEEPEAADPESGLQVIMALWQVFIGLTDPRDPRGVRHELTSVLTITVLAALCGAGNFREAGDRAGDLPQEMLAAARCPC